MLSSFFRLAFLASRVWSLVDFLSISFEKAARSSPVIIREIEKTTQRGSMKVLGWMMRLSRTTKIGRALG